MKRIPVFSPARAALRGTLDRIRERNHEPYALSADIEDHDDAYVVRFDAPGVTRDHVHVRFLDGRLIARIDRFRDSYEGFELRSAGRHLSFRGEVELPEDADIEPESGEATIRANGTLEIRVPKATVAADEPAATPSVAD